MTPEKFCSNILRIYQQSNFGKSKLSILNPVEIDSREFVQLLKNIHDHVDFSDLSHVFITGNLLEFRPENNIVKIYFGFWRKQRSHTSKRQCFTFSCWNLLFVFRNERQLFWRT